MSTTQERPYTPDIPWFRQAWDTRRVLRATHPDAPQLMRPEDVDFEMSFDRSHTCMQLHSITQAGLEHFVRRYGDTYEYIRLTGSQLIGDLSPLEDLPRLRGVHIDRNIRAERLWDLSQNPHLESLALDSAKKLTRRLDGLAQGQHLQEIYVYGPTIDGNYPTDTLEVFAHFPKLRLLTLMCIRPDDRRTDFLDTLPALESFHFDKGMFTTEEIAALCARYPHLGGQHMGAYYRWPTGSRVEISGARKPTLTLPGDEARLRRYVERFEALVEEEGQKLR